MMHGTSKLHKLGSVPAISPAAVSPDSNLARGEDVQAGWGPTKEGL